MKQIIIAIISCTLLQTTHTEKEYQFTTCDPQIVQNIYQMLKDVTEVFHLYKIDYWLDSGTLLGAIRHGGLIPWDDDLDLCMPEEFEGKLLNSVPILRALGYDIIHMPFGYKIFATDGEILERYPWTHPGCDIFITVRDQDKIFYKFYWMQERKAGPFVMHSSDIYPLRLHNFGSLQVYGPCNPVPHLNDWYGNDWYDVAYRYYDHQNESHFEKIKMILTDADRKPARPAEKLQNRVFPLQIARWPQ